MGEFGIREIGLGEVDLLLPLWRALYEHQSVLPGMPPARTLEESWETRRAVYAAWLESGEATVFAAFDGERPVGYASVRTRTGSATWRIGEPYAELESISVALDARGTGVGAALMDACREVAAAAGAETMVAGVVHSNAEALSFYEREGFSPFYVSLTGPVKPGG